MTSRRQAIAFGLIALAVGLTPLVAVSQPPPPASAAYQPGLGDLMTMAVQPRHLKIGLAGQQRNWTYAAYEVHELEEALERVAKVWPKWRDVDVAGLIKGSTESAIDALEQAIKAKDAARFDEAYGQLTSACNACHQSSTVGFITIQIPRSSPFANQDFRPVTP